MIGKPFEDLRYEELDKLNDNKGTEFLINFLKIRSLYLYLQKLKIQNSFQFYEVEYDNKKLCELLKTT